MFNKTVLYKYHLKLSLLWNGGMLKYLGGLPCPSRKIIYRIAGKKCRLRGFYVPFLKCVLPQKICCCDLWNSTCIVLFHVPELCDQSHQYVLVRIHKECCRHWGCWFFSVSSQCPHINSLNGGACPYVV